MPPDANTSRTGDAGPAPRRIDLRILGPPRLTAPDGRPLEAVLASPRRLALLSYLAVAGRRGMCSRDQLLGLFWSESTTDAGRNSLRQTLYQLRRGLEEDVVLTRGDERLGLDPERFACDVTEFERRLRDGDAEGALRLWEGDLLEGFILARAHAFDEWLANERTRLRGLASRCAWQLVGEAEEAGDTRSAARLARRAASFHPADEAGVRRVMSLLDRVGNRSGAIEEYERFAQWLAADLELEPAPETMALAEAIRSRPDAVDVEDALGGGAVEGHARAEPNRRGARAPRAIRALSWPVAILGIAGMAWLGTGGLRSPRMHVAVLPIVADDPADPELQALADGLAYSLTGVAIRLQRERESLWVVPASEVVRAGASNAADAKRLFNVDAVLTGTVRRGDEGIGIGLDLIDPSGPRVLASVGVPPPSDPSFPQAVADALRTLLELEPVGDGAPAADAEHVLPAARHLYLAGMGYLRRYDSDVSLRNAVTLLSDAIGEDPGFAEAHAGLCEARWERYRQSRRKPLADSAVASCDRAAELAASRPEVLVALGRIYLGHGDHLKARRTLELAFELEPGNADVSRWLGRVYEEQGDLEAAEQAHRRSIDLQPGAWVYYLELGQLLAYSGRYGEALEPFDAVRRLTPDNHLGYLGLGYCHWRLGHVERARSLFESALQRERSVTAYHNLGVLAIRDLAFDEAIAALHAGLALDSTAYSNYRWLGNALHWTGDESAAREAWEKAARFAQVHFEVNPRDAVALMVLTETHVLLGRSEEGRAFLDRLLAVGWQPNFHTYEIARVYELLGDRTTALQYVERSLARGFDTVFVAKDPWLSDLRSDPRARELGYILENDPR